MKSFTTENLHQFIKTFVTVGKKIDDIRNYQEPQKEREYKEKEEL